MAKALSLVIVLLVVACVANAQPQVSYITPDAGAPGMCVVVEIIAPESAHGTFGPDVPYLALAGHPEDSIVQLVKASDNALVRLGPSEVSWDGREISQMIFIEPSVPILDTSVQLVTYYNGQKSAPFTFHIVKPRHVGLLSGGGVIGTSPSNLRSARNTIVIDSLTLQSGTYRFDKSDPDASTPGNQGYLPVRILSQGPIRIASNATLDVSGDIGSTGSSGGAGGPGGGGGGSGYPGKGGDGYTGGGGDNDGSAGPGGVGTGNSAANLYDGGKSLNGLWGGSGEPHSSSGGDDGGGGGTGHPFGSSGVNGGVGSPPGGYGGGSAGGSTSAPYTTNYGGGGGGYATTGGGGSGGPADSGRAHGNKMLVPFAGGSGGGAGNNTYYNIFGISSNSQGGCGGGAGGAVELTSFANIDIENTIAANGGAGSSGVNGSSGASGGGGGSGGAIALDARDSVDFASSGSTSVLGGSGGGGQKSGGAGGLGRVRINGYVSKVSGNTSSASFYTPSMDYTGPSIQKVYVYKDSLIIIGHARSWDGVPLPSGVDVRWQWSASADWRSCTNPLFTRGWCPSVVIDPTSHTGIWRDTIAISDVTGDSEVFIVAVQGENAVSQTRFDVPPEVMSHTSGIIYTVKRPPAALVKTTAIDFGNVRAGKCSHDTTVAVYSVGKAELAITSLTIVGPYAGNFSIVNTGTPAYIRPKDSLVITLRFCPTQTKCPMNATLHIVTNDTSFDIALTGCGVNPQAVVNPLLDFGLVRVGDCKDSFVTIANTGSDILTITQESIGDPAHFKVLDPLPITVAPTKSAQLHLRFCPTEVPIDTSSDVIISDAEQGPLTVKLVGGGKQGVLSIPPILDFGEVAFDSCKDSSIDLKNVGTDTITIAAENLTVPINFHFVSPALPVSIAPNASVPFVFRFCSTDTASYSAVDTVYADSSKTIRLGGVTLLAHTGYGILSTLSTIDFGGVVVGGCKDTTITIKNIGDAQLVVDSIPNLPIEFSVQSGLPVRLAPNKTATITLRYCPSNTSTTTANTLMVVGTPSKSSPLTLIGSGLEGALSASGPVDLGCVRQGSSITRTIQVKNTGSGSLNGIDVAVQPSGALTIVHAPASSLNVGASDSIVFILTASQLGDVNATVILLWSGGGPLSIPVTAHVAVPPTVMTLDSIVSFDTVTIGDSSAVKCIRIMNPSCAPLTVDSLVVANTAATQYSIVSTDLPKLPAMIADSQVWNVCVRYKALRADTSSATLIIKSGGNSYIAGHLTGAGRAIPTSVQLTMDTVYGRPGETVDLHVRAINDITTAGITSVTFRLQFDPMQLDMKTPVATITSSIQSAQGSTATYSVKRYSLGDQEVTATYPSALAGKALIASVPFEILLPSASTAKVHLLNATFGNSLATLSTSSDGEIAIEQCDTNERITMGMQPVAVAQNNPNPFNPRTTIRVDVNQAGHLQLELYNALGEKILTAYDADVTAGTKQIEIDASGLPSGAYRYITSWSNGVRTIRDLKTMVLVK